MDIPLRRLDVVMPHQFLHYLDVRTLFQQVRGKGMAQQVRVNPLGDARLPCGGLQPFRHDAFRKGFARPALEEPFLRSVQPVVFRQLLHQRPRQQRVAVFPAFALPHPYQVAGLVDVAGLQFQQFADAQAGGVEYGEDAEEAQVFRRHVEYPLDFILAQHVGQGLLALGTVHLVASAVQRRCAEPREGNGYYEKLDLYHIKIMIFD